MKGRSWILPIVATHCIVVLTACLEPTILVGRHTPQAQAIVPLTASRCVVSGCRNEICSDVVQASSCDTRATDACYAQALCELQVDGRCGFTASPELSKCIQLNTPTTCEEAGADCAQDVDHNCRDGEWLDITRFTCGERLGEGCCKRTRVLSACEQIHGTCVRATQHACSFGQWDFTRACTKTTDSCCAPPP